MAKLLFLSPTGKGWLCGIQECGSLRWIKAAVHKSVLLCPKMYAGGTISNCAGLTQNTVYICHSAMCCAITAYNPCFVVSMPTCVCVWSQESWSSNYWKAGSCCLLSMEPPIVHKYFDNQPLQFCNGLSHVWWASVKLWISIERLWQFLRHNEGWYCHWNDDDMKDVGAKFTITIAIHKR